MSARRIGMGDPNWLQAWEELCPLHLSKSSTYGTAADPLSNFTQVAAQTGNPAEWYVAERMLEKLHRAFNIMRSDPSAVEEWPDIASLALCAEALRRR
mgnify:FL=1